MNLDEYRRGKYVWAEDGAEPTDAELVVADGVEAIPQVEDARQGTSTEERGRR